MTRFLEYISHSAGRQQVMKYLTIFSVVGGTIMTAILLSATYLR